MTNPFGANWWTTLTGGLQALFSAFVAGTLTFPSNWSDPKQLTLFGLVVVGTFFGITFATATKAKNVTGGSVQQTYTGAVAPEGKQTLVDVTLAATPPSEIPKDVPASIVAEARSEHL